MMVVAALAVTTLLASYPQSTGVEIATEGRPPAAGPRPQDGENSRNQIGNGLHSKKHCRGTSRHPTCHPALVVGAGTGGSADTISSETDESTATNPDEPATTNSSAAPSAAGDEGSEVTSSSNPSTTDQSTSTAAAAPDNPPTTAAGTTTTTRSTSPTTVRPTGSCSIGVLRPGQHPPACWRPYGSSSPFNRPITRTERLHPRSSQIIARTLTLGRIADSVSAPDTRRDWYHPIYYSTADDPAFTIECTNPDWGTCEVEGMVVRIPDAARQAAGGDGHLSVIEQHTGWEYDLWKVSSKPAGGGTLRTEWGGRTRADGDGLRSDATAAHFGLAAGVVRPEELVAGEINHALFLLVGCAAREPVFPATGKGAACSDQTDAPAIGHRFWLDMTDGEIDALRLPEWKKTILRALAHYGGYVGDTGGNEAFAIGFQSGSSYTSFGQRDPWRSFLGQPGVSEWNGGVHFNIANGVDWGGRLRVIHPCVATDSC